jgi:hypothetical protein
MNGLDRSSGNLDMVTNRNVRNFALDLAVDRQTSAASVLICILCTTLQLSSYEKVDSVLSRR